MRDSKVKVKWDGVLIWLVLIPGLGLFFWIQLWNFIEWLFGG